MSPPQTNADCTAASARRRRRSVQSARTGRFLDIKKPCKTLVLQGLFLVPGDVLLSHGEAPHYHRRRHVSLLSSVRDQVVPCLYGRQANWPALQPWRDRKSVVEGVD